VTSARCQMSEANCLSGGGGVVSSCGCQVQQIIWSGFLRVFFIMNLWENSGVKPQIFNKAGE